MVKGYLRANFRRAPGGEANELEGGGITAVGGGLARASWGAGSGFVTPYKGFIMGSASGATGGYALNSGTVQMSATDVMASWFGAANFGAGYAIMPVWCHFRLINGSTSARGVYGSFSGSMIYFYYPCSGAGLYLNSSLSYHIQWAGFIVSSP